MQPRFYTLWAINAPLDQAKSQRQLDDFHAAGLDGVVWHPRFYPNQPPYLSEDYLQAVSETILYAKSIGLAFWLYDEDGWPSGTVGGQLLKKFPQDAQRWVELVEAKPKCYLAEFEYQGKKWFVSERIGVGVDYLNPDFTRHFLELTHEHYRNGLEPKAWEYIEAIFCDEPEFGLGHAYDSLSPNGAIPWTPKLPELFYNRYAEDLLSLLPQLFFPVDDYGETRIHFWELLTDLFNENFTASIDEWCRRQGKLFTAHVKGEEHPLFQVPMSGSCHQFFKNLSLPGIDALERFPGNNFYPRQVASVAQQFGNGRCMVEVFGGAGWGATPEDLQRYLLWLGRHGLTDFVLHLSQYRLTSDAIRDWPPSQPLHVTWRDVYPEILRRVRKELEKDRVPVDTLVVAPYRGIMAAYEPAELLETNIHNASTYPNSFTGKLNRRFLEQIEQFYNSGMPYHLTDERTLEVSGTPDAGGLRLGKNVYKNVVTARGVEFQESGRQLLDKVGACEIEVFHIPPHRQEIIQPPVLLESVAVKWTLLPAWINALLLEIKVEPDGWFSSEFKCIRDFPADQSLEILFADSVFGLEFNGNTIRLSNSQNGMTGRLEGLVPINRLRFRCSRDIIAPFVWLHGQFQVTTQTPFQPGPNGTISTIGPFDLTMGNTTTDDELVQAGFPFLHSPLVAETTFKVQRAGNSIQLCEVLADAARVTLNGEDLGWTWGSGWQIACRIEPGIHTLKLELVPNTFNYFGPHHYYAGDHHIISPGQFTGRKNFADSSHAPANTRIQAWHFRPFQLPRSISTLS